MSLSMFVEAVCSKSADETSIPEWAYSEFDGLLYEGVQYNWDEVDYRLSVDYNSVPEPASASVIIGIIALACIAYKQFKK